MLVPEARREHGAAGGKAKSSAVMLKHNLHHPLALPVRGKRGINRVVIARRPGGHDVQRIEHAVSVPIASFDRRGLTDSIGQPRFEGACRLCFSITAHRNALNLVGTMVVQRGSLLSDTAKRLNNKDKEEKKAKKDMCDFTKRFAMTWRLISRLEAVGYASMCRNRRGD